MLRLLPILMGNLSKSMIPYAQIFPLDGTGRKLGTSGKPPGVLSSWREYLQDAFVQLHGRLLFIARLVPIPPVFQLGEKSEPSLAAGSGSVCDDAVASAPALALTPSANAAVSQKARMSMCGLSQPRKVVTASDRDRLHLWKAWLPTAAVTDSIPRHPPRNQCVTTDTSHRFHAYWTRV
jgi:hypothetical protein